MTTLKKRISYNLFLSAINSVYRNYLQIRRCKFGFIDPSSRVRFPILIKGIENVFLYEHTHILGHSKIITTQARFIMKSNSAAAEGLTVVTGNHVVFKGEYFIEKAGDLDVQVPQDVIVEEDVGIYSNVTLLAGVTVGRGAIIGSGTVCRKSIPPYAIVTGNPAKVVGFKLQPEEIIEHEKVLYPENERISLDILQNNYQKYFLNKRRQIKEYLSL